MKMFVKNLLLRIRLLWLVYIRNYFKNPIPERPVNYSTIFYDGFLNGIDWNFWKPNESWGNVKYENEPYMIWKAEQVAKTKYNGIRLTTALNNVQGEPAMKSGQICSWDSLYRAYGRFRCNMKAAPNGYSSWFSFWLIGIECNWEIDIVEFMGKDCKRFTCTLHKFVDGKKSIEFIKRFYVRVDLSENYHIFELDWQKDSLSWYLDGVKLCEYTGKYIPSTPMGIIINNAVNGGFKPSDVTPEEFSILFPSHGYVKFVEVMEKD